MRIKPRRPAHRVTTAHLQAAYPFVSEGGLGSDGVYIGRDVFGGSFCFDPWAIYGKEITGPNMLVIGQIGYAKSSLVKCLDEDTEIMDPVTGVMRTTAKVDTGLSRCLRVTLGSGRSVITTPEHPFLMPDGWRRADQLAVGETAAVPARIPFPEEPVRILDEVVDFLARAPSREKVLPEIVYRLPPDQLARFIAVFWLCDGAVGKVSVSTTLASERLVRQLQHLLLRFGIQSGVRCNRSTLNGRPFSSWQLRE